MIWSWARNVGLWKVPLKQGGDPGFFIPLVTHKFAKPLFSLVIIMMNNLPQSVHFAPELLLLHLVAIAQQWCSLPFPGIRGRSLIGGQQMAAPMEGFRHINYTKCVRVNDTTHHLLGEKQPSVNKYQLVSSWLSLQSVESYVFNLKCLFNKVSITALEGLHYCSSSLQCCPWGYCATTLFYIVHLYHFSFDSIRCSTDKYDFLRGYFFQYCA